MTPGTNRFAWPHWFRAGLVLLILGCTDPTSTSKAPSGQDPDYPSQYHNHPWTIALIDSLEQRYPDIVQKRAYGRSVGGRTLIGVKISDNVRSDEAEPEISFDGTTHGEEWSSSELVIRFMKELCESYGNDSVLTHYVNTREIFIYPFINPDGREVGRRFNDNGVDINRDYGYMWNGGGNSPAPWSQPESRSVWTWMNENHFMFSIHGHSGLEALYYPWGYKTDDAPDTWHFAYIMHEYFESSGYLQLEIGSAFDSMYPTRGTFYDYSYGTRGTLAWLMEVSVIGIIWEPELTHYYERNKPAYIKMLELAGRGIQGSVTDAVTGEPVPAIVWVSDDSEFWPIYNDGEVGDYEKFVKPGVYTVRASANGYGSQTASNVTVSGLGAAIQDFSLTAADGPTFGYRVEMAVLPDFNDADENMTPWALGAPDNRSFSIDVDGWTVIDMGETLRTGPGTDLRIVEGDTTPEGFAVDVGMTLFGPMHEVGTGSGTSVFDLDSVGVSAYRYVRITDDGDGPSDVADAGFDLDAVEGYTDGNGPAPQPGAYGGCAPAGPRR
ncbi:M14 family zinc carboxypeptidase [Gemmatimonadota bacterium]